MTRIVPLHCLLVLMTASGLISCVSSLQPPLRSVATEQTISLLLDIVSQLQNPNVYSTSWIDGLTLSDHDEPVTKRRTRRGDIVSLFPIDAIGLHAEGENGDYMAVDPTLDEQLARQLAFAPEYRTDTEHLDERHYPFSVLDGSRSAVFVAAHPQRRCLSGWMAHLVPRSTRYNSVAVPLKGAAPLCALVATEDLDRGVPVTRATIVDPVEILDYTEQLHKHYQDEVAELRSMLNRAYETDPLRQASLDASSSPLSLEDSIGLQPAFPSPAIEEAISNLLSICCQLQSPAFYSASWRDTVTKNRHGELVTTRAAEEGEILSLMPIDAMGVQAQGEEGDFMTIDPTLEERLARQLSFSTEYRQSIDFVGEEFPSVLGGSREAVFVAVHPERHRNSDWKGHLAPVSSKYNSVLVPLPGVVPLCALVATRPLVAGEPVVRALQMEPDPMQSYAKRALAFHRDEIAEIRSYLNMAYPTSMATRPPTRASVEVQATSVVPVEGAPTSSLPETIAMEPRFESADIEETICNLLSICGHLQNPELYSTDWINGLAFRNRELVTSRATAKGELLSLFPIHGFGVRRPGGNGDFMSIAPTLAERYARQLASSLKYRQDVDLLDDDKYPYPVLDSCRDSLFIAAHPEQKATPGWMAHLARPSSQHNCIVVPLPGAAPLCALVSTEAIDKGEPVTRAFAVDSAVMRQYADRLVERYGGEIAELRSYVNMAYTTKAALKPSAPGSFDYPFYKINDNYPGIRLIHQSPDILVVDNFLSGKECDDLIEQARPHLIPSVIKNPRTGAVEADPTRTSSNANVPQRDVPSIVSKIAELTNSQPEQLEILQVLRYGPGEYFLPHSDGFHGPTTACGFENSGRMVTVFCYLNQVDQGGATRFPELDLDVQPRQGMAVLHLPTTIGLEEDERTEHEGVPPGDGEEKWLLVTWVWLHPRTDVRYGEDKIPSISKTSE